MSCSKRSRTSRTSSRGNGTPRCGRRSSATRRFWRNTFAAIPTIGSTSLTSGVVMNVTDAWWPAGRTVVALSLLACALLLIIGAPGALAADSDLDQVMSALAQRKHGHVTFVEKKYIAVLDRPVESSGELLYDAPDRLEKKTLEPKPESLVLEGGTVSAQRGRRHYVLDLKQYPQVIPFIYSIRATLAGDRA